MDRSRKCQVIGGDARTVLLDARREGRDVVDEPNAKRLLAAYGIPVPRGVRFPIDSEPKLDHLKPPFAAKLVSRHLVHKSDAGGVRLGLAGVAAARQAVQELVDVASNSGMPLDCILVEEMAPSGVELMVGGVVDLRFGPVLVLGFGGVFVEVFKDTNFRVCPVSAWDAEEMISGLRCAPLLRGARGRPVVNTQAIIDVLLAIGGEGGLLIELQDDIAEMDINPLIVSANGAYACDARIVLSKPRPG
jgi:acetyl-CoA synthetase (ADP-forming)